MLLVKFHKPVVRVLGLLWAFHREYPNPDSLLHCQQEIQVFSWDISKDNREEANDRARQPLEAPDMVTHTYNPITWEPKQKDGSEPEFKANLSYSS